MLELMMDKMRLNWHSMRSNITVEYLATLLKKDVKRVTILLKKDYKKEVS